MSRGKVLYKADGTATYFLDGRRVTKRQYDRRFPSRLEYGASAGAPAVATAYAAGLVSRALAVHPLQVAEANARNKRHGVNVQYDPTGKAHIPSRAARNALLRLEGMRDNDGGYGDR